jgi:putative hemolysin
MTKPAAATPRMPFAPRAGGGCRMTGWLVPSLLILGLLAVTVAAIGSRTMWDFSHRQLEVYSRARRRREMFQRILQSHDEVAFAVEQLEVLGLILAIGSGTVLWYQWRGSVSIGALGLWLAAGILLLFAVTSWIPSAVARRCSAPFLLRTWWFWWLIHRLFLPLHQGPRIMDAIVQRLAARPSSPSRMNEEDAFEDEIMAMVTVGQRDGLLESDARDMIEGVIDLTDTDVKEIMTPRSRIDFVDIRMTWPEILQIVVRSGRTRLPVCKDSLDKLIGVLYVKDLLPDLAATGSPACEDLARVGAAALDDPRHHAAARSAPPFPLESPAPGHRGR